MDSHAKPLAVITVGLPARGKTFTARNLSRYLRWIGVNTHTFAVANYRKSFIGDKLRADFFDPKNSEALNQRTIIADKALNDLVSWFKTGGQVGILDASNTTHQRRLLEHKTLTEHNINVIFLECIYEQDKIVESHIKELRLTCPEYEDVSPEDAIRDFKQRIDYYRPSYSSLNPADIFPYIQIYNGGQKIVTKGISGYIPAKIVYYLMNLHNSPSKTIYLVPDNNDILILQNFIARFFKDKPVKIWTGTTLATDLQEKRPLLDPIEEGLVGGLSTQEIIAQFPEEYLFHQQDEYSHRYPRAESYRDLSHRLEKIIMELEKMDLETVIMAHESVLRCIYAYYIEIKPQSIPKLVINAEEIIELKPHAYGCYEARYNIENDFEKVHSPKLRPYNDFLTDLPSVA